LEQCDVEKDITNFIKTNSTGQEIPDAPKFIDFCREDANDPMNAMDDDDYAVAQFSRTGDPAFRTASPQPPLGEQSQAQRNQVNQHNMPEQPDFKPDHRPSAAMSNVSRKAAPQPGDYRAPSRAQQVHDIAVQDNLPEVPYNEYPMDCMTQSCRTGPPSEMSSAVSQRRPVSDHESEYSNAASFTSPEPSVGSISPIKQFSDLSLSSTNGENQPQKKNSIFQNRSPFVRSKSRGPGESPSRGFVNSSTSQRVDWSASNAGSGSNVSPTRPNYSTASSRTMHQPSPSPEPVDPGASFQLNVGTNVFDVASPDARRKPQQPTNNALDEEDPIAKALADLKGVTKQASVRQSADRYHGIGTPAPGQTSPTRMNQNSFSSRTSQRDAPPPSYDNAPVSRLGAPQPAFTSKDMQRTTQQYVDKAQNVFRAPSRAGSFDTNSSPTRSTQSQSRQGQAPQSRPTSGYTPRSASPNPMRSKSPRPGMYDFHQQQPSRATSPMPYGNGDMRHRSQSASPVKNGPYQNGNAPKYSQQMPRASSPNPQQPFSRSQGPQQGGSMALQLAPSQHGFQNGGGYDQQSPQRGRQDGQYQHGQGQGQMPDPRTRSRSTAGDGRQQFTKDGRPIIHFCKLACSPRCFILANSVGCSTSQVYVSGRDSGGAYVCKGGHACGAPPPG